LQKNPFIGKQIGNYRIVHELARGGFGIVYLARHLILTERVVAVKMLHRLQLASARERDSFLQEAQILEKLKHAYILPILDVGIDDGIPYLISEYAQDGTLRDQLLGSSYLVPLPASLTILWQVGQALQHAHNLQIIHRDLKPENILFNAQRNALLADFGISTVLATASVLEIDTRGTPAYMAPEQYRGLVSKESDQYALGCIAYELVTGQKPFTAADFIAMGFKHATEMPISPRQLNPDIPEPIEQAILKALAKEREARYPDVGQFIAALLAAVPEQFQNGVPVQINPSPISLFPSMRTPLQVPSISTSLGSQSLRTGDEELSEEQYSNPSLENSTQITRPERAYTPVTNPEQPSTTTRNSEQAYTPVTEAHQTHPTTTHSTQAHQPIAKVEQDAVVAASQAQSAAFASEQEVSDSSSSQQTGNAEEHDSISQRDKVLAMLGYLSILVLIISRFPVILWFVCMLLLFFISQRRYFTRFHFMQSFLLSSIFFVLVIWLRALQRILLFRGVVIIDFIIGLIFIALILQEKMPRLPLLGRAAAWFAAKSPQGK